MGRVGEDTPDAMTLSVLLPALKECVVQYDYLTQRGQRCIMKKSEKTISMQSTIYCAQTQRSTWDMMTRICVTFSGPLEARLASEWENHLQLPGRDDIPSAGDFLWSVSSYFPGRASTASGAYRCVASWRLVSSTASGPY